MGRFGMSWSADDYGDQILGTQNVYTTSMPMPRKQMTTQELRQRALHALKAWQEALEAEKSEQETLETLVFKLSAEISDQKEKDQLDQRIRAEFLKLKGEVDK